MTALSVTSMTVGNRKFPRVHRLALNVSEAMTHPNLKITFGK
jgi:hypothetical protein